MKEIKDEDEKALWEKVKDLPDKLSNNPIQTKSGKRTIQRIKECMTDDEFVRRINEAHLFYSDIDSKFPYDQWWSAERKVDEMVSSIAKDYSIPDIPFGPLAEIVRLDNPNDYFSRKYFSLIHQCKLMNHWMTAYIYFQNGQKINYSKQEMHEDSIFPVSIKISADARKKDVKEFIDDNWHNIKIIQKAFKSGANKATRKRPKKERDDLIWKLHNENYPHWSIVNKIKEKVKKDSRFRGLPIDEDIVSKVIKRLKKRTGKSDTN